MLIVILTTSNENNRPLKPEKESIPLDLKFKACGARGETLQSSVFTTSPMQACDLVNYVI